MAAEVLYFISDTHLADGSGADQFRYPRQLMDLLVRIESDPHAHLVLLGDFLELWAAALEGVLTYHAPIVRMVGQIAATHPVTYVVGNHDCLPWYYYIGQSAGSIRVAERFTNKRGNLVAIHGHQYDPFNRVDVTDGGEVKAPWTRKLVEAVGLIERVGGVPAGEAIARLGDTLTRAAGSLERLVPHWDQTSREAVGNGLTLAKAVLERQSPGERGYPDGEMAYEEAARSLMREGAQYVLMGHTHHPLVRKYGSRLYVNTGSWVWDRYPPTYGRYAGGKLELLDGNTHQPFAAG